MKIYKNRGHNIIKITSLNHPGLPKDRSPHFLSSLGFLMNLGLKKNWEKWGSRIFNTPKGPYIAIAKTTSQIWWPTLLYLPKHGRSTMNVNAKSISAGQMTLYQCKDRLTNEMANNLGLWERVQGIANAKVILLYTSWSCTNNFTNYQS